MIASIPGLSPKKFTAKKANPEAAFEVIGVPLPGPGFYLLEVKSPRLGAALNENKKPVFVSTAVLATNLGVHLKRSREDSLVWVTELDSARPVGDAEVVLIAFEYGGQVQYCALMQDVTVRKQAQQQLIQATKLASLGEMATGMAHELNQPLNVIKLTASSLSGRLRAGGTAPDEAARQLSTMVQQVDRAAKLITHLRAFGRTPDQAVSNFDVAGAIEGARSLVAAALATDRIDLELEILTEGAFAKGQATLLEQVLATATAEPETQDVGADRPSPVQCNIAPVRLPRPGGVAVVTNDVVAPLYLARLVEAEAPLDQWADDHQRHAESEQQGDQVLEDVGRRDQQQPGTDQR